ncbi:hypothetical protein BH762_gp053 [Gordonia phage OneUp]|uniref:Uncharacterized protein n=1 Tax=Gordonia phage OneUp TaxID=1838074 RepID=A0A160DF00_9CAUD|nr:hypothetical protein BH762_gp053 [Gordonia phage OneUp]ANA86465.1 hypothetical protein PBI_ONEUP_132 [Gordonia phage OneUp]
MKTLSLSQKDVGRTLRIETKVKSKPIRGKILEVIKNKDHIRVELQTGFGTKHMILTAANEISLDD